MNHWLLSDKLTYLIVQGLLFPMLALVLLPCQQVGSQLRPESLRVTGPNHHALSASSLSGNAITNPLGYEPSVFAPVISVHTAQTYYVSRTGNNANGLSWSTAWNELDQIDWSVIEPGDTILLDGGQDTMVYHSTLDVAKSGTSSKPIMIELASEPGRNGGVAVFGGRSAPLPYCDQVNYNVDQDQVRRDGIRIADQSWIVLDGLKWRGITIHGHSRNGIRLGSESSQILVRNVEVYDNGIAVEQGGDWHPDLPGVYLAGTNITFERAIIHDNGQDAFQSGGGVASFALRQSWLYNTRTNPSGDEPFNYCRHPDGLQIYNGGLQSGILIEESILGPGFMQGVILGQSTTQGGAAAIIHDVTLRNVLFAKSGGTNIMGYPELESERWILDHVTSHCPAPCGNAFALEGIQHMVYDSIFHGGAIYLPDGLEVVDGNCQWDTTGFELGLVADPMFASVHDGDRYSLDDYALAPGSPCQGRGSNITSVAQLLSLSDSGHAHTSSTPSATAVAAASVVTAAVTPSHTATPHGPDCSQHPGLSVCTCVGHDRQRRAFCIE